MRDAAAGRTGASVSDTIRLPYQARSGAVRFPWSKSKSNTDGGPATALFSYDRETEQKAAERYAARKPDWLAARYVLIDEVLEYRRTGVLSQSLIDACEAEHCVAAWAYSEGVRRLVELARDGHAAAATGWEALMASNDWRVRYEAIRTGFEHIRDAGVQRQLVQRGLADRSARIRVRMAAEAVFAHLIDMVDEIECAALAERDPKTIREIFNLAHELRYNERTGRRRVMGGEALSEQEAAWELFRAKYGVATG
jgi:hypothetical protein